MFFGHPDDAALPYRPNVGILLLNVYNLIWVGERVDLPGAWQMPQGGMDEGESIPAAFFRETEEEVGVPPHKIEILRIADKPLRYDFPPHVMRRQFVNTYRGQEQNWVIARMNGTDSDININTAEPEFRDWRWVTPTQLMDLIVPFKRQTYATVLEEFADILKIEDDDV